MKCPYIWNTTESLHNKEPKVRAFDIENADGTPDRLHLSGHDSAYTRVRYFHDCITDECGAYQDGHCVRRG